MHTKKVQYDYINTTCCIGLCPDWNDWDPKDALQNATEAMGLADDWLRIPQVKTFKSL